MLSVTVLAIVVVEPTFILGKLALELGGFIMVIADSSSLEFWPINL